jgi:hypothetical protein
MFPYRSCDTSSSVRGPSPPNENNVAAPRWNRTPDRIWHAFRVTVKEDQYGNAWAVPRALCGRQLTWNAMNGPRTEPPTGEPICQRCAQRWRE